MLFFLYSSKRFSNKCNRDGTVLFFPTLHPELCVYMSCLTCICRLFKETKIIYLNEKCYMNLIYWKILYQHCWNRKPLFTPSTRAIYDSCCNHAIIWNVDHLKIHHKSKDRTQQILEEIKICDIPYALSCTFWDLCISTGLVLFHRQVWSPVPGHI